MTLIGHSLWPRLSTATLITLRGLRQCSGMSPDGVGRLRESDVALLALSLLRSAESFDGCLHFCRCVGCRRVADQDVPDTENKVVRVAHANPERCGDGI